MSDSSRQSVRVEGHDIMGLLDERDEHRDGEWFRKRLEELEKERREQLKPFSTGNFEEFFTEPFEALDEMDGLDATITTTGATRDREYDADWDPSFDGWSGNSKPNRSDNEATFLRVFSWRYRYHEETLEMEVPGPLFKYYTRRHRTRSFGTYISDPFDRQIISTLANKIRSFGDNHGLGQREQINAAVRFVQSLEYTPDSETTGQCEYPKYPVETLIHQGGDCEDTSILLGAILQELDCKVAPIVLPNRHHMILGVSPTVNVDGNYYEHNGTRYYVLEATGHGWDIGELPRQYRNASARVYPVDTDPVLVHNWEAQPQTDGSVAVTIDIANFSDVTAENLDVYIEFEDTTESTLARKMLVSDDKILSSRSSRYETTLTLPDGRDIRGRCVLTLGHRLHDASTSGWH